VFRGNGISINSAVQPFILKYGTNKDINNIILVNKYASVGDSRYMHNSNLQVQYDYGINEPQFNYQQCGSKLYTTDSSPCEDTQGWRQSIKSLYISAFAQTPCFYQKINSTIICWAIAGGECLEDGYQYRCCCDLTPLGCKSDWMERRRCEEGYDWEKIPNSDCTNFLLDIYKYGCKRIFVNDAITYLPITKDEYFQILYNFEGIDASEGLQTCRMLGTPPNASCIGDCDDKFQFCKLKNVGDFFYCTCSPF
jgi:hypothetical protein